MRISTTALQQQAINAILNQQTELARTQLQVASGQRIINPSDDPVGSQRILGLEAALQRIDQYQDNADLVRMRLNLEENALAGASDLLQRARELVVQASNDTQNPETRRLLAAEVRQLSEALLNVANSQNGEGEYIFAGYQTGTQPFARSASGVEYFGDQGQRLLQVSDSLQIADGNSGAEVFQQIRTGNGTFTTAVTDTNTGSGLIIPGAVVDPTAYDGGEYTIEFTSATTYDVLDATSAVIQSGVYTEGEAIVVNGVQVSITGTPDTNDTFSISPSRFQDMFTSLDNIASALELGGQTDALRAQIRSELNNGLNNLDRMLERIVQVRTEVGTRATTLDSQEGANQELKLQLQSTLSDIRDLDYADAIGRLNLQLTGLQAAQQSFARVQGLSLFNFL